MKYLNTIAAKFVDRPNRFIAHVELADGSVETVHVKNTGRCRELLLPGVEVILQDAYKVPTQENNCSTNIVSNYNIERKTRYDLIAVNKQGRGWINIDSQVPNKVVNEWLSDNNEMFPGLTLVRPEYKYGDSRFDFYLEERLINVDRRILMEVKGCTLEREGIGYFPDAPTERGVKHLKELSEAISKGYECYIVFVVAMNNIRTVKANVDMHSEFGEALDEAVRSGVRVINLVCNVTNDEIKAIEAVTG